MKQVKPLYIVIPILAIIIVLCTSFLFIVNSSHLPLPELSDGQRGELGIDKNINESNIDNYLGRSDSVYYDMRMLDDPADYESIGGDHYLSGFINGFQDIPYPYLATVDNLPEEVGTGYTGETLFTKLNDGSYVANYEESERILNDLFPKDKYIFLMCGGGGYAGMTKNLLVKQGWDTNKIYVVGGYWYYHGKNNINIKEVDENGKTIYAFWKIPYHNIDFKELTEKWTWKDVWLSFHFSYSFLR